MTKTNYELWHDKQMTDPEYASEFEALAPRYEVIQQVINERAKQHLTQVEFAKKVGIYQSNIARLESGNYNPSLDFLYKLAKGMGKKIAVKFY